MTTADRDLPREASSGDRAGPPPSGLVAFLFTDLQGSTSAWERHTDLMNEVLERHDHTLKTEIADHRGAVFSIAGDAFGAGFHSVDEAVSCAVAVQRSLAAQAWPSGLAPGVRMGIHVGRAFERDGNYFGPSPNRAARVMSAAHGGQILLSQEAVEALRQRPDGTSIHFLGTFMLRDLPEPIPLHHLATVAGVEFPPPRAYAVTARVARPSSAFIGREDEVAALTAALQGNRLVTLVAAGGTGKTRLAVEVAASAGHRHADGVTIVELADGGDSDVVLRLAERVFGDDGAARTAHGDDLLAELVRHLAPRQMLLVLDNCEHVIATAIATVARLLAGCPHVTLLATSRVRLGLPEERAMPLAPLPTVRTPGRASPAAELFMDRALAANPMIALDHVTVDSIDAICEAVEGSPLGIELAAARVRTLTPRQIAERLDDTMSLLRQRGAVAAERQRSLEATIAWSYELLDDDERALLCWSAVFVGGFDLAGAESLARAAGVKDPIDVVESLLDKSLVSGQPVGARMRYRLPEPVRQFAAARLAETGHADDAVAAHFDHCRATARAAVALLDGHVDPPMFVSLSADLDNYLSAIRRAHAGGRHRSAMSLAGSLDLYWAETGHVGVALQVFDELAHHDPGHDDTALVHVPLLWVATMAGELPRAVQVRELLEMQLAEGRLGPMAAGGAAFGSGFIDSARGDGMAAARTWALAARAAAPVAPNLARQAYWSAGQSATAAGDQQLALGLYDAAEHLPGATPGWWPAFADTMRLVAKTYQGESDLARLEVGAAQIEQSGLKMRFVLASAFVSLAMFHAGDDDRAERWWRESMRAAREVGNLWACWVMLECAAWSAIGRHEEATAARLWHAADAFAAGRGYGHWDIIRGKRETRRAHLQVRAPELVEQVRREAPWTLNEAIAHALAPAGTA
ncbi:MAG: ATP-binding protein [Ilumatobacteraceae bacterium]